MNTREVFREAGRAPRFALGFEDFASRLHVGVVLALGFEDFASRLHVGVVARNERPVLARLAILDRVLLNVPDATDDVRG